MEDAQNMVTLVGKVPLTGAAGRPSFNYKYMARHVRPALYHLAFDSEPTYVTTIST